MSNTCRTGIILTVITACCDNWMTNDCDNLTVITVSHWIITAADDESNWDPTSCLTFVPTFTISLFTSNKPTQYISQGSTMR